MKAIEFESRLSPNQTLLVPPEVLESIPSGQPVRVLVLIKENDADQDWERLAAAEFGQGYSNSDSIYDQLSSR